MPRYLGVPASKMTIAPLGINLEGYAPRPHGRVDPFTVGFFARVAPEKGLHVLCDAYQRFRAKSRVPRRAFSLPDISRRNISRISPH